MLFSLPLLVAVLSASTSLAKSACSSSTGIQNPGTVTRKFKQASIAPGVVAKGNIHPKVQVNVKYGNKAVNLGNTFGSSETGSKPKISFTREEDFPPSRNYTVMMLDPDAPRPNNPPTTPASLSFFLHFLETNVHPTCAKKLAGSEDVITPYTAPAPPSLAKHRYLFLVWRQPPGVIKYSNQPAFKSRTNFNLKKFVKETGIELVGGNYFLQGAANNR